MLIDFPNKEKQKNKVKTVGFLIQFILIDK